MQLAVGNVEQSITVSGESPVVDALHAGMQTTSTRSCWPACRLRGSRTSTSSRSRPPVRINAVPNDSRFVIMGSSSDQNSFQYDGVDISAVSNGGVWISRGPDIMQEVEVKTTGASAEYFNFQGGVRQHRDQVGKQHIPWRVERVRHPARDNNTPAEPFPYNVHFSYQTTFEIGCPVKKDRVWFYGIAPYLPSAV